MVVKTPPKCPLLRDGSYTRRWSRHRLTQENSSWITKYIAGTLLFRPAAPARPEHQLRDNLYQQTGQWANTQGL
jgi:hypothetical protein